MDGLHNDTIRENATLLCGVLFSPENRRHSHIKDVYPKKLHMNMLLTIYITCLCAAIVIVVFFVDSLSRWVL